MSTDAGAAGRAAVRALVEDSPDPIALADADGRLLFANPALERAAGGSSGGLVGRGVADVGLPPEAARRLGQAVRSAAASGERIAVDLRVPTQDGVRWFAGRVLPIAGEDDPNVVIVFTDVTERVAREAEQAALRRVATTVARETDLAAVAEVIVREAAMLLDADGGALYRFRSHDKAVCIAAQPALASADGAEPVPLSNATATGRCARSGRPERVDDYGAVPPDPSVSTARGAGLRSALAVPLRVRGEHWGALAVGSARPGAFGPGAEAGLTAFAELASIAAANAAARAELARLVDTDPLTGLPNRRAFTARLAGEVERARRHGHGLVLAMLDLDEFKRINDTFGHGAGDAVLGEVGRRLAATCRAGELVARVGGEEFAWILPQMDAAGAVAGVERARREIARVDVEGVHGLTCSAGICDLSEAAGVEELERLADEALYAAKRAGRDRVHVARGGRGSPASVSGVRGLG